MQVQQIWQVLHDREQATLHIVSLELTVVVLQACTYVKCIAT